MATSYLPTALECLDGILEGNGRLYGTFLEGGQVIGIFSQGQTYGIIDQVRNGAVGGRRLQPQGAVQARFKVDGAALRGMGHKFRYGIERPSHQGVVSRKGRAVARLTALSWYRLA